ncbi:MAG TPA: CpsD/CapB family tyrosine-protein kinase [Syntrophobacteraceae bacterium]|nr:CpsD/CapB family tyrosine-protein kinase [Syntrophobacteraceae bacterium]
MSKIYEALQNVQRQKEGDEASPPVPVPFAPPALAGFGMEDEMLGLFKMVDTILPPERPRIIQFIGAKEREGTSTIVREFSRVAADLIGNSVLLLDADRQHPTQDHFYNIKQACSWIDVLKSGRPSTDSFHRVGESKLFISPCCNSASATPEIFDSRFDSLCQILRTHFDLVVIDSAPLTISPDGLAIASKVDGIVLVVEAEKTRWQTVRQARDNISRVGGNILGVVLNKRRFYIPQSIYKYF